MIEPAAATPAGKRRILIAAAAVSVAVLILAVGFALGRGTDEPGTAARQVTAASPSASATTVATLTASASPSPSSSTSMPSHTPKLPTEMTDEGGDCIDDDPARCGHYVAGSKCTGIEWCTKEALIEPGQWGTAGGSDPSECMWGVSKPPNYGLDDGGYATGYTVVYLPPGAIFKTRNCPKGWTWMHP